MKTQLSQVLFSLWNVNITRKQICIKQAPFLHWLERISKGKSSPVEGISGVLDLSHYDLLVLLWDATLGSKGPIISVHLNNIYWEPSMGQVQRCELGTKVHFTSKCWHPAEVRP